MAKTTCGKKAAFIYTWTRGETGFICQDHAEQMQALARVMGHYANLEAIDDDECRCSQGVKDAKEANGC